MRPFYYPMLVILAVVGLSIVAGNLRSYEESSVCTRCGRTRQSVRVSVFGTPFDKREEERITAFTRAWPGALQCVDHAYQQTDYQWRSLAGGSWRTTSSDALYALLEDPAPALQLRRIAPERAEGLLLALLQERNTQGGYYVVNNRVLRRPSNLQGPSEELVRRLREKPMTAEDLRQWDRDNAEPEPERPERR